MRRRFLNLLVPALAGLLAMCGLVRAATTNTAPDFQQVYQLLRANLADTSQAELNAAAVTGLLKALHGRATLVGSPATMPSAQRKPELIKAEILENNVAYLRVGQVGHGLSNQLAAAYHRLTSTNKVVGVVLDLRFAGGNHYAAAVAAANLFVTKKMALLKWDDEVEASAPAKDSISGPLMVLINGRTCGAAEALAAVLREAKAGLLIGNPAAGVAMTTRDFPLKNGEQLRIAANPVKLGNGAVISHVSPDIKVKVSQEDEQAYLKNPYARLVQNENPPALATNDFLAFVDHTSEADLVRQKLRDGEDVGATAPPPGKAPPKPVIQDPVLARALDLIKGLAIVREDHF